MPLTISTDDGQLYAVEVEPATTVENLKLVVQIETGVPVEQQRLTHHGKDLDDPARTLHELGILVDDVLVLTHAAPAASSASGSGSRGAVPSAMGGQQRQQQHQQRRPNPDQMRQHVLSDPRLLNQLRQTYPELADAATNNPHRFTELVNEMERQRQEAVNTRIRENQTLNADPFNVDAQRRIEEAIRHENVMANMEAALEHNPESFGTVHMLYVNTSVNGYPIKAFVDSGAQVTIMNPDCAEACGLMRLIDRRFAGVAKGVGTANILGRVHSAQICLDNDLYLPCSFTIMEGKGVDLLFGLDMLKRHQACIDMSKDALVIAGREIPFLPEHELPPQARMPATEEEMQAATRASADHAAANTASATSTSASSTATAAHPTATASRAHPEEKITALTALGVTREQAVAALDACQGNVEMAAGMLFVL